jgi:hypothetical protein
MAVTAKWYTNGPKHLVNGDVDWDTSTNVMCALCTSSYTPDQDAHEFYSSITGEVASGSGYTTKGAAIGSRSVSADTASNETRLIGGNVSWSSATFTARYAVIFRDTGTAGTSPLLGYVDFGTNMPVSAGTFTITWDATGILKIQAL